MDITKKGGGKYIIIDNGVEYKYDVGGITFVSDEAFDKMESLGIDTDGYFTAAGYAAYAETEEERARDMYVAEFCEIPDSKIDEKCYAHEAELQYPRNKE